MPPRATLACLLCLAAAALPACGGDGDAGQVQAWSVDGPYLPPPDPSAFAGRKDRGPPRRQPRSVPPAAPRTPDAPASGAPSDSEVAAELRQAYGGSGGGD